MNSMQHIHRPANAIKRLMKWPLFSGLLALTVSQSTWAADALYQNDAVINYPDNVSYPPVVDATNFVNTGSFIINFTALSLTQPFYETSDTLNYTNTGTMMANTGFRFDDQPSSVGQRTRSANFFNSGTVSCASTNNPGVGVFNIGGILLNGLTYGQCLVNSTNIVNPGQVVAGVDGMIQMAGNQVDVSHGHLTVEGAGAYVSGVGIKDLDTNGWFPSIDLGPNYAQSCFIRPYFYYLYLTNSTAYIQQDGLGTSNVITRAVFVQDTSDTNVSYNVYFPSVNNGLEDYAVVEWAGSYLNPADGSRPKHYLYLLNDYVTGSDTNLFYVNGIPSNFTFGASDIPLQLGVGPAPAGFQNLFPAGVFTNRYAFANANLISTTVSTNDISNLSPTNLPGRIELTADDEMNVQAAHITGANYLKLQSPNQFEGSPQLIQVPYSDMNLGVTNGFLSISNLASPWVPNWSGNVQAWSTRWLFVDGAGITNDYRVMLVGSQLSPISLAQVQDLILHATNSVVLSDAMNVLRTFKTDTRNLTLTTNGVGNGATSLEGELNVSTAAIYWQDAMPNLRNLTNNGAIRFHNLAQFIGTSNNVVVTPDVPGVPAASRLSEVAGRPNVQANDKVVIGTNQYVFVSTLTNTMPNQVAIAALFDGSLNNLIAAINGAAGEGTSYSTNTVANAQVLAGTLTNHSFTVAARAPGVAGNSIYTALSASATNLVWNGSYLSGGADPVPGSTNIVSSSSVPYDSFINRGWLSDEGSAIWANYFENMGSISNGVGSFNLSSTTTILTNGSVMAGGDIVIGADTLVTSNSFLRAGRSLSLAVTNYLTDSGLTNGNIWVVQSTNGAGGNGLMLPIKPVWGDLLGTTITNYAPAPNQQSVSVWAGEDRGVSANGFTNNAAIGRLVLDAVGPNSQFVFNGAGVSNAIYIDDLELADYATNGINNSFDFSDNLSIGPNMMVYFAQATAGGVSIAAKIDAASKDGKNGGRLRWVPGYAGYNSSVMMAYPDGSTNYINAALAGSSTIDSDGDGIPNASDTTPLFVPSQVGLHITSTNTPAAKALLAWDSIPGSTNYVYFKTNLTSQTWMLLTNFVSPGTIPPAGGWPIKNVVQDSLNQSQTRFYNIKIIPNSALLYGQ